MVGEEHPAREDIPVVDGPVGVTIRGLRHVYPGVVGHPAVDSVDLDIPAGTSLALVGASGAGKTTIASLVAGTLVADGGDGDAGRVMFDAPGREPTVLDPGEIRGYVSVATQAGHVFAGTLAEDLRLARPDATEDHLWDALRRVGADRWVAALDDGLDTSVGVDGLDLDPMRVQQIALARIALRDAPVVVLDESTAEAGSRGAEALEAAARAVIDGRTALVVAHRLSQAVAADRIAVIDAGRVVESGTHPELVAAGGHYAQMWEAWSAPAPVVPSADLEQSGGASR